MNDLTLNENLKKFTRISECPIRNVIARFAGKWSILVLCILAENDSTRFNMICKAIPDISAKVLTETLKRLETDGLISRKSYPEIPPRVEYSLTNLGRSLIPLLNNLIAWAADNFEMITHHNRDSR